MKKILIGVWVVFAVLIVFYVGFRAYLFLNSGDGPPVDDSDLIPSSVIVPDEENAYFQLQEAQELMVDVDDTELLRKMAEGEDWDTKKAQEMVEKMPKHWRY